MVKHILLGSAIAASFILTGCGGSSSSDATTSTTTSSTGYFVDAAVANLNYTCLVDGTSGVTDSFGAFTCQNMSQVRFSVGDLVLGEIQSLPQDGYVMPQDLVGVPREDVTDPQVTAMAQLLQSLDTDADPTNGITLSTDITTTMPATTFNANDVEVYLDAASIPPANIQSQIHVQEHLRATTQIIAGMGTDTAPTSLATQPTPAISTTSSVLTQEAQDALAYMGNEERLAYDVYMNLYNYHAGQGVTVAQLYNIAQNSESTHIALVQTLVRKYDLSADDLTNVSTSVADSSVTLSQMPSGSYDIPAIQSLYDQLYAKGISSAQDALEVGCMVEVTDINDLNEKIAIAEASNAQDVIDTFTTLRSGSYTHYWSFDQGLKNLGVSDGCCSLGSLYCHPEYPQSEQGHGSSITSNTASSINASSSATTVQGGGRMYKGGRA